jgi:hypothetical protein
VADIVEIILALRNVSQFVSGAHEAAGATAEVGDKAEQAGKKSSLGAKGLLKWAGGAAVIYGATRYVKGAVSATEDLAKSTLAVSRTTGMDTQTSSEWAALMKERGVSTKQFQTSLVKLSKTMEASRTGTAKESATVAGLRKQIDQVSAAGGKKAPAEIDRLSKAIARAQGAGQKARLVLQQLGVSQADVAKGNTAATLYKVADGLKALHNPAQRAALMQTLFGRSGQALLPILMKGAAGVRKLLAEQKANGNYISGKGLNTAKKLIAQQRALDSALAGVKVQLGQQLLPVILQAVKLLVAMLKVIQPLTKNATLFKIAIGALALAFIAYKAAVIASTIAQLGLDAAMLPTIATVAAIALGIAALIAVGVLLYKNWGAVKRMAGEAWAAIKLAWSKVLDALKVVWGWVKAYWPLLLGILVGPFGLAVGEIIQHFGAIKKFVLGVVADVKQAIQDLVQYVQSLPGKVGGLLKKIPGVKQGLSIAHRLHVPGLQHGGSLFAGRTALVGERGPELITAGTGLTVTPLALPDTLAGSGPRSIEVVVPVMLDGREIARSVARVGSNQLARR